MNKEETLSNIRKAKQGDIDAFATVFEELRPLVFSVAFRLAGPNDAEDVLMETYLKAWKAIPNFNERSTLKTWIYRITHNCAQDFLRKRSRENHRFVRDDEEAGSGLEQLADHHQPSPPAAIEAEETRDAVDKALDMLPEEHRVTLLLRFADELSYSEIAAATGVSIGTVMSRLFNGKRKLKKALKKLEL